MARHWGRRKGIRSGVRRLQLLLGLAVVYQFAQPVEPIVRIGIGRGLETLTITSAEPFDVEGVKVRSVTFRAVITVAPDQTVLSRDDLERRMTIDVGDDGLLVRSMGEVIAVDPGDAPLRFNGRSWRGALEVRGRDDGLFTLVNELPLEAYLLGVVPNELGPEAFPELEALKAQAIAARTYIIRNMGQFESEGFDICATDQCQVYFGLDTEHEMATQAVDETRGMIATWQGMPINALYSSTCGGRTEDARNVFGEDVPYLVSTECLYEHPEPTVFETPTVYENWEEGLLGIADVGNFGDAGRFLGLEDIGEPAGTDLESVASFIKEAFFPEIPTSSPERFLEQEGILEPGAIESEDAIILRLLMQKGAFEWRDARLISWDGQAFRARVGQGIRELRLDPDAPVFVRLGDARVPVASATWFGGEFMQLRIVDDVVEAIVYEPLGGTVSADRYSSLAHWEVHLTSTELDERLSSFDIGHLEDIEILERGASGRVVKAELRGTEGNATLGGPRLRTALGLRDSLVYVDRQRNARRQLIGITLYGGGWGHGVGMCQVGAFGMAMDGASAEEILTKYYKGIEIETLYQ